MSNLFSSKKIIDRKNETEYIANDVEKYSKSGKNKVLVIWSDSGIGKTSIIKKLEIEKKLKRTIVMVSTPPTNSNELVSNGDYMSYISQSISSKFQNDGWTLKDFLMNGMSERQQKVEASKILTNVAGLPTAVLTMLCERVLSINSADAEKISTGKELDNILINSEYIKSMLKIFDIVLSVSNIQNADPLSIMEICRMLSELKNQYVIFEYTTKDRNADNIWQLAKTFEQVADVDVIEINELPIEYALTIVSPTNLSGIEQLEKFYNDVAKGNLYKLNSIKKEIEGTGKLASFDDPIRIRIDKLGYQSKLILAIVCLHDGEILIETFNDIIKFISTQYNVSQNDMDKLADFISINKNKYTLHHASIIDSFDVGTDNYACLAAYSFLKQYYNTLITDCITNQTKLYEYTLQLLKLYSRFEPHKVLENLSRFKQLIISSISEAQGSSLLKKAFFSLPDRTDDVVKLHIVVIGYEVGFYESSYQLLQYITSNSESYNLVECMLLNRTDQHRKLLQKCSSLLSEKGHSNRFILILNMIKMLSERSLNDAKAYRKTFQKIFQNKKYQDIYEYGFLLRNSQIVLSYTESLKYIQQSVQFFTNQGNEKDAACSALTYSVQLARLGLIDKAIMYLESVRQTLLASTFEKHIVYVNQAAMSLLKGIADENTLLLLEESQLSSITNFDKVVILNNKLCWYIMNRVDERLFLDLKSQIDYQLLSEPDSRLHRRTYINYALYYKHVKNDIGLYNLWMKSSSSINVENDELGDSFITGVCNNPELKFLTSKPFYVSFITYWHFDLPMI